MAGETEATLASQVGQDAVDPWVAAFAALDQKDEKDTEAAPVAGDGDATGGSNGPDIPDTDGADQGEGAAAPEGDDGAGIQDLPGGPGDLGGADSESDGGFGWDDIDVSEESIASYREQFQKDIEERTIRDVAAAYIKKGARNTDGRLGASINDPDVCKRDRDGVPRFYNPETGREFTGDNPRRQAQEWVDDYNRELRDAFNQTCREYSQRLLQQEGTKLAVMEFAPKYKALDPVRRSMLDSIIEDYEVTNTNGDIIGYSCDLDKALAAVNRQVRVIQERFAKKEAASVKPEPSGPALDTPGSGGGAQGGGRPQFKSIAEAMEWQQDQLLAKMKGSKR